METVKIERDGAVWMVTIERPQSRNAVDGPTAKALADAFRAFDADPAASVALLTGAGGHFCAGADVTLCGRRGAARQAMARLREPAGDCVCAVSPRLCDARTACCVHL